MPEDLVCKFFRCISVGFWRDPWRINGPARMKGRGGRRGESLPLSRLYPPFAASDVSFFHSVAPIPTPSVFLLISFFLSLFLFLSCFSILPESASVQPPNKRTDRVYSRGSERLSAEKKRRNRRLGSVALVLFFFSRALFFNEILGAMETCIPRNASTSRRRERKRSSSSWSSSPHANLSFRISRKGRNTSFDAPACDSRQERERKTERGAKRIIC